MKTSINRTLLAATLLAFVPLAAQSKPLRETIVETLETHPQQVRVVERHAAALESVQMEEAGYRPTVDLSLGIGREKTYSGSDNDWFTRREAALRLSQMLYDGYETKSRVDSSMAGARAEAARSEERAEGIALEVATVYLDVLRQRQLLEATKNNLAAHQDTYEKIARRAEMGVGSGVDATQAKGRLALAKYNLSVVEGNLWESEINFERVVGYKPAELQMPNEDCCTHLPYTAEDARYVAIMENPRFAAAVADHESSLGQVAVARSAMQPKVHLEIDLTSNKGANATPERESALSAMIRARHNLYRGGADEAQIKRAEYLSAATRAQGEKDRRDLEADAEIAWYELESIYLQLPELERRQNEAQGTRDAYSKQFNIGQRSLLDLLDSENELFTATNDLISARIDEQLARYTLLARVGRFMDYLELEAPGHPEHRNDEGELPELDAVNVATAVR
ncbi:MAG TPA: TolC family outer membrane protein [Marinobacterium sp.]|nr:TolC family outer membrane protein [Marinobacterium sp.]